MMRQCSSDVRPADNDNRAQQLQQTANTLLRNKHFEIATYRPDIMGVYIALMYICILYIHLTLRGKTFPSNIPLNVPLKLDFHDRLTCARELLLSLSLSIL